MNSRAENEIEDVKVEFTENAIKAAAHKSIKRKTGARGLRSILEIALLNIMFEAPSIENFEKIVIDQHVINGEDQALVVLKDQAQYRLASNE